MEIIPKVNCSLCYALVFVSSNWKLFCCAMKEDSNYVLTPVWLHSTSMFARIFMIHVQANTSDTITVKAGHSTAVAIKRQENARAMQEDIWHGKRAWMLRKVIFTSTCVYFGFQISPWYKFWVLLFTVLVLETSKRGIGKPAHYIKWKTLIWLSVSEATLARRRERTALSNATRRPLPKPSKKILH